MKVNVEFEKCMQARIDSNVCINCGRCKICPTGAITEKQRELCKTSVVGKNATNQDNTTCNEVCPFKVHPQAFVNLVARDDVEKAFEIFTEKCPMPYTASRVCSCPCENACRMGIVSSKSIAINKIERYIVDNNNNHQLKYFKKFDKKIAIVGGGASGICCAYKLASLGYKVTIYEKENQIGGTLLYGVPDFKLDKKKTKAEISRIVDAGIEVVTNVEIGKDLTIKDLREQGYNAVVVAVGTSVGKMLDVENSEGDRVYDALSVLKSINLGKEINLGEKVIIIGAGAMGLDCARTLRAMDIQVTCVCAEDRKQLPSSLEEVKSALKEGVNIIASATPVRINRKNKNITSVDFLQVEKIEFDDEGNRNISTIEDADFSLDCDTVIYAVGQMPNTRILQKDCEFSILDDDRIEIKDNNQTTLDYLFACGDATRVYPSLAHSMASGIRTAECIDNYLLNKREIAKPNTLLEGEREVIYTQDLLNIKPQLVSKKFTLTPNGEHYIDTNKIFEKMGLIENVVYPNNKDKRIAVVGAGLQGLACANELATKGYSVTIFEATNKFGGNLRYLVNDDKFDKLTFTKRIKQMLDAGIEIKYNQELGKNLTVDQLIKSGYDMVCLAIGSNKCDIPDINGNDCQFVYDGITYLTLNNNQMEVPVGKKAVVVGSTSVAVDSAVTLARNGVETTLVCVEDKSHFIAGDKDFGYALNNEVRILTGVQLKKINYKFIHVNSVTLEKITKYAKDKSGKTKITVQSNGDLEVMCDTVVFADSIRQEATKLCEYNNLKCSNKGEIQADDKLLTSNKKVACVPNYDGDCVKAIQSGKLTAQAIDSCLNGKKAKLVETKQEAVQYDVQFKEYNQNKASGGVEEVDSEYSFEEIKLEAMRCMRCGYACIEQQKCVGCGICSKVCPVNAITMVGVKDEN